MNSTGPPTPEYMAIFGDATVCRFARRCDLSRLRRFLTMRLFVVLLDAATLVVFGDF